MDYQGYPEQRYLSRALRLVILAIITIIVIAVLVWAIFFRSSGKTGQVATPTSNSHTSQPASVSPENTNSSASSSTPTPSTSSNSSSSAAADSENQTLVNTGPGDVVALFIGTTLVVGGGRYWQLRRKTKLN